VQVRPWCTRVYHIICFCVLIFWFASICGCSIGMHAVFMRQQVLRETVQVRFWWQQSGCIWYKSGPKASAAAAGPERRMCGRDTGVNQHSPHWLRDTRKHAGILQLCLTLAAAHLAAAGQHGHTNACTALRVLAELSLNGEGAQLLACLYLKD
jgi:hypothetical protein